jgi:hypothetical protein
MPGPRPRQSAVVVHSKTQTSGFALDSAQPSSVVVRQVAPRQSLVAEHGVLQT